MEQKRTAHGAADDYLIVETRDHISGRPGGAVAFSGGKGTLCKMIKGDTEKQWLLP